MPNKSTSNAHKYAQLLRQYQQYVVRMASVHESLQRRVFRCLEPLTCVLPIQGFS